MSLHSGIDTLAFVSGGVYSGTYGSADQSNINNLFASYGLFEDAPEPSESTGIIKSWFTYIRRIIKRR